MEQTREKKHPLVLEVIACTVADAIEAERGGAHRLEVISHFAVGGLTPPLALVREIRASVTLPLRVMLRESERYEVTDKAEIARLCTLARELNAVGVEGVVPGFLRAGEVDVVTKSGTNQWHGSLFEFARNDVFNANRWTPGQSNLAKDPLHRHQFGGTIGGNMWNGTADNQPFSIRQQFNNPGTLTNLYTNLPGGVSPFPYSYSPQSPRFITPAAVQGPALDFVMPYVYQMNFTVQRQVTKDLGVTAAYVATLGHRFRFNRDYNYPVFGPGATTGNVNARRPIHPNVLSNIAVIESIINSAHHGLQLTVEKRFARNFTFRGFYTFSKALDGAGTQGDSTGETQNMNNLRAERGRTAATAAPGTQPEVRTAMKRALKLKM